LNPVVIRFGRLGDTILLSSLLRVLHSRYGRRCWLIAAGQWSVELYSQHRDVATLWALPSRHVPLLMSPAWWHVWLALRRNRTSPVYVCEPEPHQLRRIRRVLSLSGVDPARCVFISDEPTHAGEHWVERLVRFGRRTPSAFVASDYPSHNADYAPCLELLDADRVDRNWWLAAKGGRNAPLILLQPGNRLIMRRGVRAPDTDDKYWPVERWAQLMREIRAFMPQAVFVVCGTHREQPLLQEIRRVSANERLIVAALPLRRLFALCEIAHSMISVDTGPAHAAAALGVPLVVLFGGSAPQQWLPRSGTGRPVIAVGGAPESRRADEIQVSRVFDAWRSLYPSRLDRKAGLDAAVATERD
jgi:ADP-heptose:LPS heptosyltransferase